MNKENKMKKCEYCGDDCEKVGSIGINKLMVCYDCWCIYTHGDSLSIHTYVDICEVLYPNEVIE